MKTRKDIAERVRRQAEIWSENSFHGSPTSLSGTCAVCSAALALQFAKEGHKASIVVMKGKSDSHCFVYSGGQVYDITATQFWEVPKVYMPNDFKRYGLMVWESCGKKKFIKHFSTNNIKAFQSLVERWRASPTTMNIEQLLSCEP